MKKIWSVFVLLAVLSAGAVARADEDSILQRLKNQMAGQPEAVAVQAQAPAPAPAPTFGPDALDGGTLRLTPDSTKIIHLAEDAASVIVANPAHAAIVLDSPRLLVVMPRQSGTTAFTVMNEAGRVILQKTVIVSAVAGKNYMRVRRMCGGQDESCVPNAYYYCPDGCYEVTTVGAAENAGEAPPPVSNLGGNDAGMNIGGNGEIPAGPGQGLQVIPPTEPGGGPQVVPATPAQNGVTP